MIIGIVVVVWLVVGVVAAQQRGYVGNDLVATCKTGADTALTVLAGPLNYAGVNPEVQCRAPQPSR